MKLLIASTNPGKIREFREMLSSDLPAGIEFDDLTAHPGIAPPDETGGTFRANAMLKAAYYGRRLNCWSMADDSGLCVNALGEQPGVHSARWAELHGRGKGDLDNNRLLVEQLRDVAGGDWQVFLARFECALALADANGRILLTTAGRVDGRIIPEPRGSNGFGYDPHFLVDSLGRTTAELSPAEKHAISHRGQALRRMQALMRRISFY